MFSHYYFGGEFLNNARTNLISEMTFKTRSDGRIESRITVNGQRKSFYGDTKTEVKNKAKDYLKKIEAGYKEPKRILFSDYMKYWLTTYKHNKIEESSYTRLFRVYDNQLKDTIGKKMIGNISTSDIQALIDNYANPTDGKTKPLALSGLRRILHFLTPCFQSAVKEAIIHENPCDDVLLPKESNIKTQTKQQITMSDEEISDFRKAALSKYSTVDEYRSRDGFILLLMLNLGLRTGEMLALEWSDIDMKNRIIKINKTIQSNIQNFNNNHENAIYYKVKKSTKTKAGMRTIPINETVYFYLNELIAYDKRNEIKCPYVCATAAGTRQTARNLQRSLDRICRWTNIRYHITLHTLRHTFGSTLVRRGVNIEVVSKLMGHANITITYNKYIHVLQEEQAKTMKLIQIC